MKKMLVLTALLGIVALTAPAATWQGTCDISFTVTETMNRKFGGTGAAEASPVDVAANGAVQAATWKMEVQPGKLSTKKEARDKEMHKMFRLPEFASATGEVKAFDLATLSKEAGATNQLPFTLTIIGTSQELTAAVTNVKDDGSKLTFDADFTIDMKAFGLKPKVLLGVFKVRNEVPVRASFTLTR